MIGGSLPSWLTSSLRAQSTGRYSPSQYVGLLGYFTVVPTEPAKPPVAVDWQSRWREVVAGLVPASTAREVVLSYWYVLLVLRLYMAVHHAVMANKLHRRQVMIRWLAGKRRVRGW
jgi:hypothetical protein